MEIITDLSPVHCIAIPVAINGYIVEYVIRPANHEQTIGRLFGESITVPATEKIKVNEGKDIELLREQIKNCTTIEELSKYDTEDLPLNLCPLYMKKLKEINHETKDNS